MWKEVSLKKNDVEKFEMGYNGVEKIWGGRNETEENDRFVQSKSGSMRSGAVITHPPVI